jgi:hypothetical protein
MHKTILTILLLTPFATAADYPSTVLKSDGVKMTVMLPDAAKGYYRGTRFDWSGVIGPVEIFGKTVFIPWKNTHNPLNNDDITGPCDEFGNTAPLNFKEAKVGERFLKIGVGELVKGNDPEYAFHKKYTIAAPGTWKVEKSDSSVSFAQSVKTDFGYAYDYEKVVAVTHGGFTIAYRFKNTGNKRIDTDVYNHNFFNVKGDEVGPNYSVTFGFVPKPVEAKERFDEIIYSSNRRIGFKGPLDKGSIYAILSGYDETAKTSHFELRGGNLTMKVTGDRPFSKVALWGIKTTFCPEPFIAIKLAPGETMTWNWKYEFGLMK